MMHIHIVYIHLTYPCQQGPTGGGEHVKEPRSRDATPSSMIRAVPPGILSGPIVPTMLRLALPTIIVPVVQTLVGVVETYFVSCLGTEALAGVALVFHGLGADPPTLFHCHGGHFVWVHHSRGHARECMGPVARRRHCSSACGSVVQDSGVRFWIIAGLGAHSSSRCRKSSRARGVPARSSCLAAST